MSERAANLYATDWSEPRVAEMKRLWGEGFSASMIAGELGHVTRNAVIAKLHRAGLTRDGAQPSIKAPRQPRRSRPRGYRSNFVKWEEREYTPPKVAFKPRVPSGPEPVPLHKSLMQLERGECRWPYGDGPFTFCGHLQHENSSYCRFHDERSQP